MAERDRLRAALDITAEQAFALCAPEAIRASMSKHEAAIIAVALGRVLAELRKRAGIA